jgi:TatD DNase family protein
MPARGLVDTHAHLMDAAFDHDRAAVLERAAAAGVTALLVVGYDLRSSRAAVDLARAHPHVCAAVGIHPNSAAEAADADFAEVAELAQAPEVVAIGETGLDYYRDFTPPRRQREALDWHMRLAAERDLPLVTHNRQADGDVASALESFAAERALPGVLHCFSSTDASYLERVLRIGVYVSFAGPLTYKNAPDLRAIAKRTPPDRLLVETDCPYLAPASRRGQRNEPAFVRETAACLAELHGLTIDILIEQLWRNSVRVFPALAGVASGAA